MGLIKTALIAGAGVYAVKKISKSREERRNKTNTDNIHGSNQQQPPYSDYPDQRGYQQYYPQEKSQYRAGPREQEHQYQHSMLNFTDRRPPHLQDQPLYLNNSTHYAVPQQHRYHALPPPHYQSRTSGFVEPDELSMSDVLSQGGREKKVKA
jgi:hypothetical protein